MIHLIKLSVSEEANNIEKLNWTADEILLVFGEKNLIRSVESEIF